MNETAARRLQFSTLEARGRGKPIEERRCRFVQQERFTGILVGLFKGTLDKTETGFEEMNAALKKRAEAAA